MRFFGRLAPGPQPVRDSVAVLGLRERRRSLRLTIVWTHELEPATATAAAVAALRDDLGERRARAWIDGVAPYPPGGTEGCLYVESLNGTDPLAIARGALRAIVAGLDAARDGGGTG